MTTKTILEALVVGNQTAMHALAALQSKIAVLEIAEKQYNKVLQQKADECIAAINLARRLALVQGFGTGIAEAAALVRQTEKDIGSTKDEIAAAIEGLLKGAASPGS